MRIAEILAHKGSVVVTMPAEATVSELVERLRADNLGAVVVSPDGRRIAGIVSERDVVRRLADDRGCSELMRSSLQTIMTTSIVTCRPGDTVTTAMETMTERRIRHVPVVDESGGLVGIISIGDAVKSRIQELQFERDQLEDYMTSGR